MQPVQFMDVGSLRLPFDGQVLSSMHEISSQQRHNVPLIRSELSQHGYVLMRDALPVSLVQQVRQLVLSQFSAGWGRVAGPDIDAALMLHGRQPGILLSGFAPVTQHAHMQQLINAVKPIMHDIYGEPAVALPQAWVRIMGAGELTDEHADYFMFQEQAFRMLTCWIPLGDYIPDVEGILSICAGSHDLLPANPTETVENVDELPVAFVQARHTVQSTGSETNRTHISTTSRSVVGPDEHWHVARSGVRMGDIVVFDIRAVHASSRNLSNRFRLSVDTRWLPASRAQHLMQPDANPSSD